MARQVKNLIWIVPLGILVIVLIIFIFQKYANHICGNGICQSDEVNYCNLDCDEQCITQGIEDEKQCSVGWQGTYIQLVDNNEFPREYLIETEEIDYSNPQIMFLAQQLKRDTPKETAKAIAKWTYENIRYESDQEYYDCYNIKASEILSRKTGLCSTMSKLNIALLRAVGIPSYSITGCWKYNQACQLLQTFYRKDLKDKFVPIKAEEGYVSTKGSLHNWVVILLYENDKLEPVILESTAGIIYKDICVNYKEYYVSPDDSKACGLNQYDSKVEDCREW